MGFFLFKTRSVLLHSFLKERSKEKGKRKCFCFVLFAIIVCN